jgi:predicted nucleotidyltransferase
MAWRAIPYATRVAQQRGKIEETLAQVLTACHDLGDVDAVYAFGSYATGEIGPTSDLDLLIVRRTSLRRAVRDLDIVERCCFRVGVDMVVVTPDEYATKLPTTSFGRTILRTARRVDAG